SVAIAATGAPSPAFAERLKAVTPNARAETLVLEDADFETILERAQAQPVDILVGNSKGLRLSRALSVPLVRCGFPIHDRMGAQRVLHLGYRGTVNLLDLVCNALMEARQREARSGYTYV
ncbi:MAG TPA: nitrogenase component 1, partial [Treponemataceae bacterium]|nr:nitrogenase component 1 [Treponemataceae bacterium]